MGRMPAAEMRRAQEHRFRERVVQSSCGGRDQRDFTASIGENRKVGKMYSTGEVTDPSVDRHPIMQKVDVPNGNISLLPPHLERLIVPLRYE